MFHYFVGEMKTLEGQTFLTNKHNGLEVHYNGQKSQGAFFLYPYMDDQHKTISYFAFDSYTQKKLFLMFYKIQGVGPKTAFNLTEVSQASLQRAVDEFNTKVLTAVPGIGPKTAKRLLVELKSKLSKQDISKMTIDDTLLKQIIKTLTTMGYSKQKITSKLSEYVGEIHKDNLQEVIIWLVKNL